MTMFEGLVLGVVQGVTEFLPISSTAHLRIVPALAGWHDPGAAFTAVLQLGTLVAVVGYFLPDLLRMVRAALAWTRDMSRPPEPAARQLLYIVVGTLPVGIAGIAFKHHIEGSLRSLWVIATALIVVALALAWVERAARHSREFDDIGLRDALIIGCAQALALVPGVSRSGSTMTAGRALRFERASAARFSFLMSMPITAAAAVLKAPTLLRANDRMTLIVGIVAAAVSGWLAIAVLLRYVSRHSYGLFALYRLVLGAAVLALVAARG